MKMLKDLELKISWIILFIARLITDLYFDSKKALNLSPYKISALRSYVQWQSREGQNLPGKLRELTKLFCFDIDNGLKFFFTNKTFLFFKIESWNFQNLFENYFCETSQNFSSIRQPRKKIKVTIVWISWMSWNFLRFPGIQF